MKAPTGQFVPHHSNPREVVQVQSERDDTAKRELIEKVGKAYFDACRKIAEAVSKLKEKKSKR